MLSRHRSPDGRRSQFDPAEVDELARRGRPRRPPGLAELEIESQLTRITGDRLYFRGHDAIGLASSRGFEDVAGLLWAGEFPDGAEVTAGWSAIPEAVRAGTAAQAALPEGTLPLERLQVIVPALAAADPLRLHLGSRAVVAAGKNIIAGMVDCLPPPARAEPRPTEARASAVGPAARSAEAAAGPAEAVAAPAEAVAGPAEAVAGPTEAVAGPAEAATDASPPGTPPPARTGTASAAPGGTAIADRLWRKLCPYPPDTALLSALRAALVLLADHELAASTLAARVAASVRADPYAVVATGLGAVGGALHGGASLAAETMLSAASGPAAAPRVVGDMLRRGERIPGFGHFVYRDADPRAAYLLGVIRDAAVERPGPEERLAVADAVSGEMRRRGLPGPNIDFALAVLVQVSGMISGGGEAIFAVARAAGWLAHALEEYARDAPLRPRAAYTGPAARDGSRP